MREISLPITIDDIDIADTRRQVNPAAVKRLADSIDHIGLRHPITVRERGERYQLIAGRHRIEAFKKLGREHIPATIVKMTNDDARLWEIAENLHRADLSKLERDEQVAEWIKIVERQKPAQSAQVSGGRGLEGGLSAAVRELGVERTDAQRSIKVAALSDEAKEAARQAGLDDNRSALLEAASKPTVAEQVAAIHQRHTAKVIKLADDPLNDMEAAEKQVAALMSAWNKAGQAAREEFLLRIDRPVMDRQFA
jgi:ParB family chromosome partitioning protein